jgi:hypothetical protein
MTDDLEDSAQWRDEIEIRVGTLEVTVETEAQVRAKMDQDMSDLKLEFRAQRGLLQALQETQSEHTAILREHTAILRGHGETLREHSAILRGHGEILRGHGEILRGHGEILQGHGEILQDHSARLGRLEAGQARLEAGLAEVHAGVQTIVGLLDREIDETGE